MIWKGISKEEERTSADVAAADTFLSEATSKLEQVLHSEAINKQELKVSYMMIDAAIIELSKVKKSLAELDRKKDKLLDKSVKPTPSVSGTSNAGKQKSGDNQSSLSKKKKK